MKRTKPLKRPESVLVVVHTVTQALLLKRVDHSCFWQSVTGSLEWGELPAAAATRELEEETGLSGISLRNTGICRSYSILPEWRHRYAENTFRNREHLFFCALQEKPEIRIDPNEHSDLRWVDIQQSQHEVFSWSNKIALSTLPANNSGRAICEHEYFSERFSEHSLKQGISQSDSGLGLG